MVIKAERTLRLFFVAEQERQDFMKKDVEYLEYMWPMRHYLITCADSEGNPNIIAVSFCMPVSRTPPLIACAIGKSALSCSLIETTGAFVMNVPTKELEQEVYFCGYHSGRDRNKFREAGFTPVPGRTVRVPSIGECIASMECILRNVFETGDKKLFIGEVVEAYAEEDVVKGTRKVEYAMGIFPKKVYATRFGNAK